MDGDGTIGLRQIDVIQADRINHAAMGSTLDRRNREYCRAVLGIKKTISERAATASRRTGCRHLGIQRAIHTISKHTPQGDKIWVGG